MRIPLAMVCLCAMSCGPTVDPGLSASLVKYREQTDAVLVLMPVMVDHFRLSIGDGQPSEGINPHAKELVEYEANTITELTETYSDLRSRLPKKERPALAVLHRDLLLLIRSWGQVAGFETRTAELRDRMSVALATTEVAIIP